MKKDEALKRAREALLAAPTAYRAPETIAFIDEALAEQPAQQQEPVAWMGVPVMPGRYREAVFCSDKDLARQWDYSGHLVYGRLIVTPLYTSPPASKPMPEDYTALEQALTRLQKRYADLEGRASKPWVGLTDEEIYLATNQIDRNERGWAVKFARAIEAKLREKNA